MAKRLVGLDPTPTGIGSHQRTVNECTVCGTEFDVERSTCPNCESQLLRRKTTTPRARFNLAFAVVTAGLATAYNLVTGKYPKEGPGA